MRKNLSVLGLGIAVLVTLGLSVATVGKAIADSCDECSGAINAVWWSANTNPMTVTAASAGGFVFDQVVNWSSEEPRDQGTITVATGTENILDAFEDPSGVTYVPALFFPDEDCCSGSLTIQTSGSLEDPDVNGTLKSKASIVYPFMSSTKTVTINHG